MEQFMSWNSSNQINQEEQPLSLKLQDELKFVHDKFYEAFQKEAWSEIILILTYLRKRTVENSSPIFIKALIDMGIIPHILYFLSEKFMENQKLQIESAWILANVSTAPTEDIQYLVQEKIIPVCAKALKFDNDLLHENAMWALANIAGEENLKYRDMILDHGVLTEIIRQLCNPPKRILYTRTAAWFISILIRGKPFPDIEKVLPCLTIVAQLIHNDDCLTQEYAIQCLACLTENKDEKSIKEITGYGFIPKVIKMVNFDDDRIIAEALRVIGNLSFGNQEVTKQLINLNLLQILPKFLDSRVTTQRNEACFILSNLVAERFKEHSYFILNKLMPLVVERLSDKAWQIKSEATSCLANFLYHCSFEEVQILVSFGALDAMLYNLSDNNLPLIEKSLVALSRIFAHGQMATKFTGGANIFVNRVLEINAEHFLENLQHHENHNIYELASDIMDSYFQVENVQ